MKFRVYAADGVSFTEKEIEIPTFEGIRGVQTLKDLLVTYQANKRQGTRKTKTRADVNRTGKKYLKQKGSGGSRHGDKGAPIFKGGGTAHGAKPQDWSKPFNRKEKRLAFARALFDKASEGQIALIERFELPETKTKLAKELLDRVDADAKTLLISDQQWSAPAALSARNLDRVSLQLASDLNAWDLVRYEKILVTEAAFDVLVQRAQPLASRG